MSGHLDESLLSRVADGEEPAPAHLRECARCANDLAAALQLKLAVRQATPRFEVPPSLRERIVAPRVRRFPLGTALAIAATLALVVLLGAIASRAAAARELADMHSTIVGSTAPIDVVSTDRHTVKPWFEGKVPFAVNVPELAGTPFHLAGGRVVFWRGEPGAYLLVTKGAHRISLFLFRAESVPGIGRGPRSMTIESWRKDGIEYVAVSDLSHEDVMALRARF